MAWLLAGVVEPDTEGVRDASAPILKVHGISEQGISKRGNANRPEPWGAGVEGYDGALSADSYARATMEKRLTTNLAKRKRAAAFLYQLLVTVSSGSVETGVNTWHIFGTLKTTDVLCTMLGRALGYTLIFWLAKKQTNVACLNPTSKAFVACLSNGPPAGNPDVDVFQFEFILLVRH